MSQKRKTETMSIFTLFYQPNKTTTSKQQTGIMTVKRHTLHFLSFHVLQIVATTPISLLHL